MKTIKVIYEDGSFKEKNVYTISEVAKILGISVITVRSFIEKGEIKVV